MENKKGKGVVPFPYVYVIISRIEDLITDPDA